MSTLVWTSLALIAFAANSILCRLALGHHLIDPASFTAVRLLSGSATLWALVRMRRGPRVLAVGNWTSAVALAVYAVPFSFAYLELTAGTGALILFGSVQVTMIFGDIRRGRRPDTREWVGLALALGGLVYLTSPGLEAPDPFAAALMAVAGFGWGIYSLRGRGSADPVAVTTGNFLRATAVVLPLLLPYLFATSPAVLGMILATASGALSSALGYVIWYRALRSLNATQAGIAQLLVPLIAALGGVAILSENFTLRLLLSGTVIAAGVAVATIPFLRRSDRASSA
jgi:drug/metabolite transporter (DMT)-like permease